MRAIRSTVAAAVAAVFMVLVAGFALTPASAGAGEAGRKVAPLPQSRSYHTATLLQNGTVLVAGGAIDASAEVYDPAKNRWEPTGPMTQIRAAHTATLLGDGRVLVAGGGGGGGGNTASAEIYDPATREWRAAPPMKARRAFHTATLLDDGRVLVAGGQEDGHGPFVREAEIFDPRSNTWGPGGTIEQGRSFHAATKLGDGTVLVTGGQGASHDSSLIDAVLYDPKANSWSPAPRLMGTARVGHSSSLLADGTVLLAGGTTLRQGDNDGTRILASAELYDPAARAFRPAPPLAVPRVYHAAVVVPGGKVFVVGGNSRGNKAVLRTELYDPAGPAWASPGDVAAVPESGVVSATLLEGTACGQACGQVMVIGGEGAELVAPPTGGAGGSAGTSGSGGPAWTWSVVAGVVVLAVLASVVLWRRRPSGARGARPMKSATTSQEQATRAHRRQVALVTEREVPVPRAGRRGGARRRRPTGGDAGAPGAARADAEVVLAALGEALGALRPALASLAALRRPRLLGKVEEEQARVERATLKVGDAGQALAEGDVAGCGKAVGEAQRELSALGGTLSVALTQELAQAAISRLRRAAMTENVEHLNQANADVAAARGAGPRAALLAELAVYHALAEGWALAAEVLGAQAAPAGTTRRRAGAEADARAAVVGPGELETFAEVGGLDEVKAHLRRTVGVVLERGADDGAGVVHNGILLYGPPGTGKTLLARATAGEYGLRFLRFSPALIASAFQHEPAKKLRQVFAQAAESAPCLLFLDEVDAIGARRDGMVSPDQRELATQLLNSLEEYREVPGLVIMAATNAYDHLDPALREGRFDSRVAVPLPDMDARRDVLRVRLERLGDTVDWDDVDLDEIARKTAGRSGAALAGIVGGAAERALAAGGGLGQAELVAEVEARSGTDRPETLQDQIGWDDVVLPEAARRRLTEILLVFQQPDLGRSLGVAAPAGVLLHGPPGTGKTTVARALASQVKASFYECSAADLLSKWVGESEQKVAQLFTRARANRPAIIFVDEVDALLKRRSADSSAPWEERVVSQFLRELDGLNGAEGVLLVGATNRLDIIDDAVRERRLVPIEVPLPDEAGRLALLEGLFATVRLGPDVDLASLAAATAAMSGADLKAVRDAAGMRALTRAAEGGAGPGGVAVTAPDLAAALADRGVAWTPAPARPANARRSRATKGNGNGRGADGGTGPGAARGNGAATNGATGYGTGKASRGPRRSRTTTTPKGRP